MIRRFVSARLVPALAVAAALAFASAAQAQRGWGGGRPAGGYGGSYLPGGQFGGFYPGVQPGVQPGYGYPVPSGGYPGGYYQAPGTGYVSPGTPYPPQQYAVPQYGYAQPYTAPQTGPAQQPPAAPGAVTTRSLYQPSGDTARIVVRLPAAARLWVDDYQSRQTGPERVLTTPPLPPGRKYHYTIKAQWDENGRPVTRERSAEIQPGGETTVDFTQPAPPPAPPG